MTSNNVEPIALVTDLFRIPRGYGHLFIPATPGLYLIHSLNKIYFGWSRCLEQRVPQSEDEQSFRGTVYYLPAIRRSHWKLADLFAQIRKLEALCIQSLHTITWGNSAPLFLINKQHATMLPDLAWSAAAPQNVRLALNIAITLLQDIGLHHDLCDLPCRRVLEARLAHSQKNSVPTDEEVAARRRQHTFKPADNIGCGHFSLMNAFAGSDANEKVSRSKQVAQTSVPQTTLWKPYYGRMTLSVRDPRSRWEIHPPVPQKVKEMGIPRVSTFT